MDLEKGEKYIEQAGGFVAAAGFIGVAGLLFGSILRMEQEARLGVLLGGTAIPVIFLLYANFMLVKANLALRPELKDEEYEKAMKAYPNAVLTLGNLLTLFFLSIGPIAHGIVQHAIPLDCGSYAATMGAKFGIGSGIASVFYTAGLTIKMISALKGGRLDAVKQDMPMILLWYWCSIIVAGGSVVAGPLLTDALEIEGAPAIAINVLISGFSFMLLMTAMDLLMITRDKQSASIAKTE